MPRRSRRWSRSRPRGRSGRSTTSSTGTSLLAARLVSAVRQPLVERGAGECRERDPGARRWPPWRRGGQRRPAPGPDPGSVCPVPSVIAPSFFVASPSFMATATICACAPSMRVPLDLAQPRGRVVYHTGSGPLQFTHAQRQRSNEQAVGDPHFQRPHCWPAPHPTRSGNCTG